MQLGEGDIRQQTCRLEDQPLRSVRWQVAGAFKAYSMGKRILTNMYRFFRCPASAGFVKLAARCSPHGRECRAPRARVASLGARPWQLEMEPAAMSTTGKRKLADSAESSTAAPTAAPTPAPLSIVTATAGSKGRKQKMEDVTVTVDWLDAPAGASVKDLPARRRAFYAILDGHGGRDCADWVAERLPALLAARLGGAEASSAIKEAVKQAFAQCDEELLVQCARHGWTDGCCCIGMLLDLHCSPPRAYVANLGDSRAYAAVDASVAAREAAGETVTAAAAVSTGGGGGGGGGGGSGGSGGGGELGVSAGTITSGTTSAGATT